MSDPHELIVDYFDDVYPHDYFGGEVSSIKDAILSRFKDKKKIKILDLCTGTGRVLGLFYGDNRFDLVGVDVSDKMLNKARKNYPKLLFRKYDIKNFPNGIFKKKTFHCILMTSVSIQLFNHHERKQILKTVNELLDERGVFIFDIFAEDAPEPKNLDKNVIIKGAFNKDNFEVIIIYHRIPFLPPKPSKQYVHLIKRKLGEKPTICSGVIDFYNINLKDIYNELEESKFSPYRLPTKKQNTKFIMAEKRM